MTKTDLEKAKAAILRLFKKAKKRFRPFHYGEHYIELPYGWCTSKEDEKGDFIFETLRVHHIDDEYIWMHGLDWNDEKPLVMLSKHDIPELIAFLFDTGLVEIENHIQERYVIKEVDFSTADKKHPMEA